MGIIIKQSIKGTIYSYLGAFLGVVNVLVLMPKVLLSEQIGLINLLVALSNVFAEFSALGFNQVTTRLFSYFRNRTNKHNGFLFITLAVTFIGLVISIAVFFILRPGLIESKGQGNDLFIEYNILLVPIIIGTLYYNVFDNLLKVLYSSTLGTFYKEVFFRMLLFFLLLALQFKLIDFSSFLFGYVVILIVPAAILMFSLIRKKELSAKPLFGFVDRQLRGQMIKVSWFGMLSSISSMVISNLDKYIAAANLDLKNTGIYSIAFFMGSIILKPSMAFSKISSVILADSWKKDDLQAIKNIYREGCLHMYLAGAFILLGIWINLHNIFLLLPPEYAAGQIVVIIIGLAYLTEMISGASGMILVTSKHYPFLTYLRIISGLILIGSGYLLAPVYGIKGVAMSVLLSRTFLSGSKIIFLYAKFKMHPFGRNMNLTTLVSLVSFGVVWFIPYFNNVYIDILVRSSLFSVIFLGLTLAFRISASVEEIIFGYINRFVKK